MPDDMKCVKCERLEAEVERLRGTDWYVMAQREKQMAGAWEREARELKADNERLRDLADDAVAGLRYIEQTNGRLYGVGWDRVYDKHAAIDSAMKGEGK